MMFLISSNPMKKKVKLLRADLIYVFLPFGYRNEYPIFI
jgi:hypothetical protein